MKHKKRLLSLLLTISMAISLIPATVMADGEADDPVIGSDEIVGEEKYTSEDGSSNNDDLFAGYVNRKFGITDGSAVATKSSLKKRGAPTTLGSQLTGNDLDAYTKLVADIQSLLNDNQTSTTFAFPEVSRTYTYAELNETGYCESAQQKAFDRAVEETGFDLDKVVPAMLYDFPYEMFWYDKTTGVSMRYSAGVSASWQTITISITYTVSFSVAVAYSASGQKGTYELGSVMSDVNTALANANQVVTDNRNLSDEQKLVAYKEWICDAVSYNNAALGSNVNYGDPWQLIYVFDGDTSTNVVCEGYAKAFKYLCDQTDFTSDRIGCYLVSGRMWKSDGSGEPHMWNIVTLDDGNRYLVDVTNCDTNTIGAPDKLFLKAYDWKSDITVDDGNYETTEYSFWVDYSNVYYYYTSQVEQLYQSQHELLEVLPATPNYKSMKATFRHSCSFQNTLAVNYYVKESDLAGYDNIYLEVSGAGYSSRILRGVKAELEGENYYRFQFSGIYSQFMGNTLKAIVHASKNGEEYISDRDIYSVKSYAYNTLKKTGSNYSDKFKTFVVDLLNYGSALVEWGYDSPDPSWLVNKDLTQEQRQNWGTKNDVAITTEDVTARDDASLGSDPVVHFTGSKAFLADSIAISIKMLVNQTSVDNVKVVFTYTSKATNQEVERVIPLSECEKTVENGRTYYWAKLDSIVAQDARTMITAKVYDGDQQISYTYQLSIEIYMASILRSHSDDTKLVKLIHKMMNYCVSAENYFEEKRGRG